MAVKNIKKAGKGWIYDDSNLTYDGATDPTSGLAVLYDSAGTLPVFTNTSKNTTTWKRQIKTGGGWLYDEVGITYDGATDPASGLPVYYDSVATAPVFTNQAKNIA